jgi:hypothetical protein
VDGLENHVYDAADEAQKALIDALEQYATFLEEGMDSPVSVAHVHGWVCPEADVKAGKQHRERIAALRSQLGSSDD